MFYFPCNSIVFIRGLAKVFYPGTDVNLPCLRKDFFQSINIESDLPMFCQSINVSMLFFLLLLSSSVSKDVCIAGSHVGRNRGRIQKNRIPDSKILFCPYSRCGSAYFSMCCVFSFKHRVQIVVNPH